MNDEKKWTTLPFNQRVNQASEKKITDFSVAMGARGELLIAWQQGTASTFDTSTALMLDGKSTRSELPGTTRYYRNPKIVSLDGSDALIAWRLQRNSALGGDTIAVQQFRAKLSPAASEPVILNTLIDAWTIDAHAAGPHAVILGENGQNTSGGYLFHYRMGAAGR